MYCRIKENGNTCSAYMFQQYEFGMGGPGGIQTIKSIREWKKRRRYKHAPTMKFGMDGGRNSTKLF